MKIVIPSNDKKTIFERTGRAHYFAVVTVESTQIKNIDYREAPEHDHAHHNHSNKELVDLLIDCNLLIVRKIGNQLKQDLADAGLAFELTKSNTIEKYLER